MYYTDYVIYYCSNRWVTCHEHRHISHFIYFVSLITRQKKCALRITVASTITILPIGTYTMYFYQLHITISQYSFQYQIVRSFYSQPIGFQIYYILLFKIKFLISILNQRLILNFIYDSFKLKCCISSSMKFSKIVDVQVLHFDKKR